MGIKYNANESDTNSDLYESGRKTVNTAGVVAAVSTQAADGRQFVRIYNDGPQIVYFGPSGLATTDMEPLRRRQSVEIAATPDVEVVLKTDSGTSDVIIQEIG
jgi:hypothetical protein